LVGVDVLRPDGPATIKIAITVEAYEAIRATMALGSVLFEPEVNVEGQRAIWLDARAMSRLISERPGETFSHVIMRLPKAESP
jgi:hypothetical protein